MNGGHKVNSVQGLFDDAQDLYSNFVVNGDNSADVIIADLKETIKELRMYWNGDDAYLQINDVITVTNGLIVLRNALGKLAQSAGEVANEYREIQISNGAKLGQLGKILSSDLAKENAVDVERAGGIDIDPKAAMARNRLVKIQAKLDAFVNGVKSKVNSIEENWQEGLGREQAKEAFESFYQAYNSTYKPSLERVVSHIETALRNYNM